MAFFKKFKLKANEKWYPRSVTVGKPVNMKELAKYISSQCTASPADTYAVLVALGGSLGHFMADGRTVKLEGMGTFYYTANAEGNGVDSEEEVSAKQIKGVRVRFIPETSRQCNHKVASRALVNDDIDWVEWGEDK